MLISDLSLEVLAERLKTMPESDVVHTLKEALRNQTVPIEKFKMVAQALAQYPQLQRLDLSCSELCALNEERLKVLMDGLCACLQLQHIDLADNALFCLNWESFEVLMDGLSVCPHLQWLDLSTNSLYLFPLRSLQILMDGLARLQLQHINLSNNEPIQSRFIR